jgi:DNA polymerase-3 subunit chi
LAGALFYHLARSSPAAVVALISTKALGQGMRVLVRCPDGDTLARIDRELWTEGGDGSFLPHGAAGGAHDADQPVLLAASGEDGAAPANGGLCLIAVGGAPVSAAETGHFTRACVVFDGADPAQTEAARALWRGLAAAGIGLQYWSEASGAWVMERRSGA